MYKNIYKDKVVLVTGDTGFKGSWLSVWLTELGANVIGYALEPPSEPSNFAVSRMPDHITHVHGDILDYNRLTDVFQKYQPEFVFHLAAQAVVRSSYTNPKLTFDTNAGGTVNVLEAVRNNPGVRVLLCITSDKCYENREWVWGYRECDPMGGFDPYSASKGCAELIVSSYLRSFFSNPDRGDCRLGIASARAGNAVGGGDWGADRLIPDCVRSLCRDDAIRIRNPFAVRPWQHVLELLSGYLWLGALLWDDPEKYGGPWNFGPGDMEHLSVKDIVSRFISIWGSGSWEDLSGSTGPHEAAMLKLCCDKANVCLTWRNTLSINDCIEMTAEWYKAYYGMTKDKSMYPFCVEQINAYTEKAGINGLPWTA